MSDQRLGQSIVVAVGRSGATAVHRLVLEIYRDSFAADFETLYEPFLWDSGAAGLYPLEPARASIFERRDALSEEGIYLHTAIPLFAGPREIRPDVTDHLARYLKAGTARPLAAHFTHANGRLAVLDTLYPDARFLVVLQNPLDAVNAGLSESSFFGAEFHRSDYPRFTQQVAARFGVTLPAEHQVTPAFMGGLWCHFMNIAALQHAAGKPNYQIIVHEDAAAHPDYYTRMICEWLGAAHQPTYDACLRTLEHDAHAKPALLSHGDVAALLPLFEQYAATINSLPTLKPFDPGDVQRRYANPPLTTPYQPRGLGWSPAKLEKALFASTRATAQTGVARSQLADMQQAMLQSSAVSDVNIPVSVVVTSFNNIATLPRTIESIRRQSYPVAEIIVGDDGSSDGSRDMLRSLAQDEPRLRLLFRDRNIGVSANRNDAVRNASSAFVTQLDGDDLFHPTKIEREVRALRGRRDCVAFSDTLRLDPEVYWDCSALAGLSGRDAVAHMISLPMPSDTLFRTGPMSDPYVAGFASWRSQIPRDMLLSADLFLDAGGYDERCSIYEDWGFKIRVAEKARHWLYSGGLGTLYRPSGLSRKPWINHVHGCLWILCNDTDGVIQRNRCQTAAFSALLMLMKISGGPDLTKRDKLEAAVGPQIAAAFAEIREGLIAKPVGSYDADEQAFYGPLQKLINSIGFEMGKAATP